VIDIHAHVLPGVDDGPKSPDESIDMLRAAADCGVTDVVATPHMSLSAESSIETYEALVEYTNSRLRHAGLPVAVHCGGEIRVRPELLEFLDSSQYGLGGSRFVLLELTGGVRPPNFAQLLGRIHRRGFRVILAHAERYSFVQQDVNAAGALVGNGVLIQVNTGSIAGKASAGEHRTAIDLLSRGLVHFIASDAHEANDYTSSILPALRVTARIVGNAAMEAITRRNPMAILADMEELPPQPSIRPHAVFRHLPTWLLGLGLRGGTYQRNGHRRTISEHLNGAESDRSAFRRKY
jgi:protein-tyrosine phosphatase